MGWVPSVPHRPYPSPVGCGLAQICGVAAADFANGGGDGFFGALLVDALQRIVAARESLEVGSPDDCAALLFELELDIVAAQPDSSRKGTAR